MTADETTGFAFYEKVATDAGRNAAFAFIGLGVIWLLSRFWLGAAKVLFWGDAAMTALGAVHFAFYSLMGAPAWTTKSFFPVLAVRLGWKWLWAATAARLVEQFSVSPLFGWLPGWLDISIKGAGFAGTCGPAGAGWQQVINGCVLPLPTQIDLADWQRRGAPGRRGPQRLPEAGATRDCRGSAYHAPLPVRKFASAEAHLSSGRSRPNSGRSGGLNACAEADVGRPR